MKSLKFKTILGIITLSSIVLTVSIWIYDSNYFPVEDWRTTTPETVGMNSNILDNMIDYVENTNLGVNSILIIKNGYLITEWYVSSTYNSIYRRVFSVSKSITSALIGIAIKEGFIKSVDEKVLDYFPDKIVQNLDEDKQAMTIEHLLTMTSGLYWPEYYSYDDQRNVYWHWKSSSDHIQFVLDCEMVSEPGQDFNYNTGVSHLLMAILERATNMSAIDFAAEKLFKPLHISDYYWLTDPQGVACGGDGLHLKPRGMAKIGYLYLKGGFCEGKQIIPYDWIETSTTSKVLLGPNYHYGYQWWIYPDTEMFAALGYGQQQINVLTHKQLVIVFTGSNTQYNFGWDLVNSFIIPAIVLH